jgi:hypothetical protein
VSALTKVIHFIQYVSSKNYYSDRFLSGICNLLSEHGQVGAFPLTKPDIYKGKPVIKWMTGEIFIKLRMDAFLGGSRSEW